VHRSASIVAATAAVALLATGCSAGGGGEDANTTLSIYGWSGEVPDGIIAAFEEETGIDVTFDSFDSNETMIAQLDAGQSGYDVVQPSQYAVQLLVQLDRTSGRFGIELEDHDANRWQVTPANIDDIAEELRPSLA